MENSKIVVNQGPQELVIGKPDMTLDISGLLCPFTSYETVQVLKMLNGGQLLEVITTDRSSALETIPAALRRRNLEFAVLERGNDSWIIRVRQGSGKTELFPKKPTSEGKTY